MAGFGGKEALLGGALLSLELRNRGACAKVCIAALGVTSPLVVRAYCLLLTSGKPILFEQLTAIILSLLGISLRWFFEPNSLDGRGAHIMR